ncbi:sensor domain-containing protein [Mycobacterium sp. Aquia_213]|uniref:sensor domain-containing protein n=1 Tax=Mycobacterium sp. Aquia_213 TaxID=2991728 RepID=UPI00226E6E5B|nr:sensor domain-containing protein [Mycobacterium sp. Aquia_213]WAC92106.1 sensor domain-containing protein [Mycobacterium sp. Aquia_213]
MRQRLAVFVLTALTTIAVGCTSSVAGKAVPADESGAPSRNPVAVSALEGLLLSVDRINAALGAKSMKVWVNAKGLWDWSPGISDKNCLAIDGPAQEKVYAGTGWTAMRGQRIDDSVDGSKKRDHYAIQAVVAFASAHDADAFYDSSVQSWPACSKRRFTDATPGQPETVWTVAGVTTDNGTLSTSEVQEGGDGWTCQRALTSRNNVVIDVVTCAYSLAGASATDIASQLAAKVAKQ